MENINININVVIFGTIGMPSCPAANGPRVNWTLLVKRARIEGLLILDYFNKYSEIYNELLDCYKKENWIKKEI